MTTAPTSRGSSSHIRGARRDDAGSSGSSGDAPSPALPQTPTSALTATSSPIYSAMSRASDHAPPSSSSSIPTNANSPLFQLFQADDPLLGLAAFPGSGRSASSPYSFQGDAQGVGAVSPLRFRRDQKGSGDTAGESDLHSDLPDDVEVTSEPASAGDYLGLSGSPSQWASTSARDINDRRGRMTLSVPFLSPDALEAPSPSSARMTPSSEPPSSTRYGNDQQVSAGYTASASEYSQRSATTSGMLSSDSRSTMSAFPVDVGESDSEWGEEDEERSGTAATSVSGHHAQDSTIKSSLKKMASLRRGPSRRGSKGGNPLLSSLAAMRRDVDDRPLKSSANDEKDSSSRPLRKQMDPLPPGPAHLDVAKASQPGSSSNSDAASGLASLSNWSVFTHRASQGPSPSPSAPGFDHRAHTLRQLQKQDNEERARAQAKGQGMGQWRMWGNGNVGGNARLAPPSTSGGASSPQYAFGAGRPQPADVPTSANVVPTPALNASNPLFQHMLAAGGPSRNAASTSTAQRLDDASLPILAPGASIEIAKNQAPVPASAIPSSAGGQSTANASSSAPTPKSAGLRQHVARTARALPPRSPVGTMHNRGASQSSSGSGHRVRSAKSSPIAPDPPTKSPESHTDKVSSTRGTEDAWADESGQLSEQRRSRSLKDLETPRAPPIQNEQPQALSEEALPQAKAAAERNRLVSWESRALASHAAQNGPEVANGRAGTPLRRPFVAGHSRQNSSSASENDTLAHIRPGRHTRRPSDNRNAFHEAAHSRSNSESEGSVGSSALRERRLKTRAQRLEDEGRPVPEQLTKALAHISTDLAIPKRSRANTDADAAARVAKAMKEGATVRNSDPQPTVRALKPPPEVEQPPPAEREADAPLGREEVLASPVASRQRRSRHGGEARRGPPVASDSESESGRPSLDSTRSGASRPSFETAYSAAGSDSESASQGGDANFEGPRQAPRVPPPPRGAQRPQQGLRSLALASSASRPAMSSSSSLSSIGSNAPTINVPRRQHTAPRDARRAETPDLSGSTSDSQSTYEAEAAQLITVTRRYPAPGPAPTGAIPSPPRRPQASGPSQAAPTPPRPPMGRAHSSSVGSADRPAQRPLILASSSRAATATEGVSHAQQAQRPGLRTLTGPDSAWASNSSENVGAASRQHARMRNASAPGSDVGPRTESMEDLAETTRGGAAGGGHRYFSSSTSRVAPRVPSHSRAGSQDSNGTEASGIRAPNSPTGSSAGSGAGRYLGVQQANWAGYKHANASADSAVSSLRLAGVSAGGFAGGSSLPYNRPGTANSDSRSSTTNSSRFPSGITSNGGRDSESPDSQGLVYEGLQRAHRDSNPSSPAVSTGSRGTLFGVSMRLKEEDIDLVEELPVITEQTSLFGIRRRLVATFPNLGKSSALRPLSSRKAEFDATERPGWSVLVGGEKEMRKREEQLEAREKELAIEAICKDEIAAVTIEVWTEQRNGRWTVRGAARHDAIREDHLPEIADPWAIPIDAKGIVRRKKLKSNIEMSSTRTVMRCTECMEARARGMSIRCHTCKDTGNVEWVYVIQCIVRLASFTPLKLPAHHIMGTRQPGVKYLDAGDPAHREAVLRDRAIDGLQAAAQRVGRQHFANYAARLLMGKATITRRGVLTVAVSNLKGKHRRHFEVEDGTEGKVSEVPMSKKETPPSVPPPADPASYGSFNGLAPPSNFSDAGSMVDFGVATVPASPAPTGGKRSLNSLRPPLSTLGRSGGASSSYASNDASSMYSAATSRRSPSPQPAPSTRTTARLRGLFR
ncbi:hypothetical protein CBOM_03718 [Ceraceosorus bombacis]|uniref:Uncharacterized protein n=1 Tax=Ceraceosorus bombacis TaxID=401625 RepID=A0A0P1BHB8_9BASI|nr:hypothetical protein CBOM_03718 [Ceraceosorus bombacis]